ncbi:MAG: D-alanine--poly(phosphoribitol) ligase subunit DltA [Anaerovoracaceae bacterium]|nr:D-alanine--poly(phosphoribitol) ligase subunit DltA [Anaerovoracaceae bacterium]
MFLLDRIKEIAEQSPDKIALINQNNIEDSTLTYRELELYSDRLAQFILLKDDNTNCVGEKKPIIVYGHKNPYMIVAFLACAKAGHPYCPIDISSPYERVVDIIEEVKPEIIFALEPLEYEEILPLEKVKAICKADNNGDSIKPVDSENVFYILFTSGSTGKPKGVEITYACLNNFLAWISDVVDRYDIEELTFINQAPFSFDLSVMDLYTNLYMGGTLNLIDKDVQMNFAKLFANLKESSASIWVSTPSFADMCLTDKSFSKELMPEMRLFLFCGEILTNTTAQKLLERFPAAKIVNTYGPTESTVAVTEQEITKEIAFRKEPLPIGKAKKGTKIEIWNQEDRNAGCNEDGEIVIIGNTVARGYFNNTEETRASFLTIAKKGKSYRAYKTGDKGFLDGEGILHYIGRKDHQIKLNGYRIEIGDIEKNMMKLETILNATVIPKYKDGKVKNLVAFVTISESEKEKRNKRESIKILKEGLRKWVPEYMIPKKWEIIDMMPMNSNGKIDRKKLEELL